MNTAKTGTVAQRQTYGSVKAASSLTAGPSASEEAQIDSLLNAGSLTDALNALTRLIDRYPQHATLHYRQGAVLFHLGRLQEAVECLQAACLLQPMNALFHDALGMSLFRLARCAEAAAAFIRASILAPENAETVLNLAACEFEQKRFETALRGFEYAAARLPDPAQALVNQAVCLGRLKRHSEALNVYRSLASRLPDDPRVWSGMGIALHRCGYPSEAYEAFEQAVRSDEQHLPAWLNWGVSALDREDVETSLHCFRRAVSIQPSPETHWNLSQALLTAGEYEVGFAYHEARLSHLSHQIFRVSPGSEAPRLSSLDNLRGKTVFVYDEQGMGDTIHFARYLILLKRAGATVALRVYKGLRPVLETLGAVDIWVDDTNAPPPHAFQCPIMSLAHVCATTADDIPLAAGYLMVPEGHRPGFMNDLDAWVNSACHSENPSALLWGIMWAGNPMNPNDEKRSIPLPLILQHLPEWALCPSVANGLSAVRWVTLTNALSADDEARLAEDGRILNLSRRIQSFADTAALIQRCDRVIVVDTSVAHLAGALGARTHLLLPRSPDWRWGLKGERTGWYDSVRLFRQTTPGDWEGPLLQALQTT